jgi:hypothetical protein
VPLSFNWWSIRLPRPLAEYDLKDWMHLRPVLHRLKQARYDRLTARHVRLPAPSGNTATIASALAGRNVMVTVCHEDPTAIDWQCRLIRRFVPDPIHVIADNSHDNAAAREIERVVKRHGLPYLRLPINPWSEVVEASRSHGIALNWLWHNLIRPGVPEAFGFLDADLFPTAPDDPFAPLAHQDIYGPIWPAGGRWYLWAGFCFFRFAAVRDLPLDFGQDWFAGLDTGGANWWTLYRNLDRASLREPSFRCEPPDASIEDAEMHHVGPWLHEFGTHTRERGGQFRPKRERIAAMLRPVLEEAAGADRIAR